MRLRHGLRRLWRTLHVPSVSASAIALTAASLAVASLSAAIVASAALSAATFAAPALGAYVVRRLVHSRD